MQEKRILYFDILNILACFCVICLHHNSIVHWYKFGAVWNQALAVEVMAYWAVPIFLMICGATLMSYRERYDTVTFFKKRVMRVVIPFLVWSVIFLLWKINTNQFKLDNYQIKTIINAILSCKIEGVYWYFPLQISFYCFFPIIAFLIDKKHRPTLWYAVGMIFVINSCIEPIARLTEFSSLSPYGMPINSYFIFILLGYLLSTEDLTLKQRKMLYVAGLFALVFRYLAIYYMSHRIGHKDPLFFDYGYFTSVLLAVAVFVYIKYTDFSKLAANTDIVNVIKKVSACSLGVYLIHILVMHYELKIWGLQTTSFAWRTIMCLETYVVCISIILIMKKLPVLKHIVP